MNHVTVYNYSHPYDYYWGRPVGYGIGPYSLGFWWMMMEWNASRRAEWLYHNQSRISTEAYAEAARDAVERSPLVARLVTLLGGRVEVVEASTLEGGDRSTTSEDNGDD